MKTSTIEKNFSASLAAAFWIGALAYGVAGCRCSQAVDAAKEQRNRDLAALPQAVGGLPEQLAAEAASRQPGDLSLEAVIEKSKVPFNAPAQVLGKTVLARYCATAKSLDGLTVTVCEFPSADQASRGAAEAKAVHGSVSGWQSRLRKASLLEVVSRSDAKAESVTAVIQAFENL